LTTGTAETTRPSLHDGLRLIRALLGEPAFATVTSAMRLHRRRFGACIGRARTTRLRRPRICRTSIGTFPSTAFRSTFVTTRTPLIGTERAQYTENQNFGKEKYFFARGLT
jgi:hypothetical protein